jgi:predicted nucleic acid-binding protein
VIYLDSAALVKLVHAEVHSEALETWLDARAGAVLVASVLVEVEVVRAIRRGAAERLGDVGHVLDSLHRVDLTAAVRTRAAAYELPGLRSLDAIHLATAEHLNAAAVVQVSAFVTYDQRLAQAAAAVSLPVVSPGAGS